jgi:two-component system sensor histidine kinase UhpB
VSGTSPTLETVDPPRDVTPVRAVTGEGRAGEETSRLRRPLVLRVVGANVLVAAAAAAFASAAVVSASGETRALLLVALIAAAAFAAVVVNLALVGPAGKLLDDLARAMSSAHRGEMDFRVKDDWKDQDLRRLSVSFNEMCRRLGSESLSYAGRQLGSVEEERRRIGRELHDETSQTLAASLVRLDLCDKALQDNDAAEAHRQVLTCAELIGHTMEELKLLVYDLRPVMLDDFGLVPTLRWYIQSHLQGAGPTVVTDFEEAGMRLPGEVETALYRITQEALANAVRHSSATKIYVRLITKPGFASLAVIDNGVGFDPDNALHGEGRGGVGLASVRERVELVGGTVNVESATGRGTRLYVVVPLQDAAHTGGSW